MIAEQLDQLPSPTNDGVSPGLTPCPRFTEIHDANALAPSPEHPTFSTGQNGWGLPGGSRVVDPFHDLYTPPGEQTVRLS